MTDNPRQQPRSAFTFLKGRRISPLISPWISSAIFAGLVYYAEKTLPALHDVAGIIYWMLLGICLIATARWTRVRSRERREADRRKSRSRA